MEAGANHSSLLFICPLLHLSKIVNDGLLLCALSLCYPKGPFNDGAVAKSAKQCAFTICTGVCTKYFQGKKTFYEKASCRVVMFSQSWGSKKRHSDTRQKHTHRTLRYRTKPVTLKSTNLKSKTISYAFPYILLRSIEYG